MLVTELIRRGALYHAHRTAILFGDERMSFREVDLLSNRVANAIGGALGLSKGDPVTLLLDNGLHSLPCDFGCAKAGLVRTPLNGRLSLDARREVRLATLAGPESGALGSTGPARQSAPPP